ncbi:DUF3782 domain-containing protein [Magnetovirga frankeli]|nr:DUF3782 domain-containing protein [gamma proteobacterium SS-5]
MLRGEFADQRTTESRFDRVMDELQRSREESERKWEQHRAELQIYREECERRSAEHQAGLQKLREESEARSAQHSAELKAYRKECERRSAEHRAELQKFREESERKWEERDKAYRQEFDRVHEEIMNLARKQERSIGALGARWGISSERTFRNALAAVLTENFAVEVFNVNEFDDSGEVFGRPDQVELDVVISNGTLLLFELKSSASKADIHFFERKCRFYERRHQRKADRLIFVSPMVEEKALKLAQRLGVEVFTDTLDIKSL